jgi:hypothetical protein
VEEAEQIAPARACQRCGGALAWEKLDEGLEERWLGVCEGCGWLVGFLPDQPGCVPRDPLRVFLAGTKGEARREAPPWIRLFRTCSAAPWNVEWLHAPGSCVTCGTQVTFAARTWTRPGVIADCLLCLACGRATVEHLRPGRVVRETPVVGTCWTPPDVGIARLREAVFRPFIWKLGSEDE